MGCEKNGSKPGEYRGGRKKGTPNKRTLALMEILNDAGYSPVAELIRIAAIAEKEYDRAGEIYDAIQDARIEKGRVPLTESIAPTYLSIMQKSAADIMPYLYPRRKAVELSGVEGKDLFQSFADLVKQIADESSGK